MGVSARFVSQTHQFWFDLDTTFLRAEVAILVRLGGDREPIVAL